MVEIPDKLRSLFTGAIERRNDSYVIEMPKREVERGAIALDERYRVVVLGHDSNEQTTDGDESSREQQASNGERTADSERTPPVEEGEQRRVTIEAMGNHGDGIAKVERGYVVIVPGTTHGDEVTIRIDRVRDSVAFAEVLQDGDQQNKQAPHDLNTGPTEETSSPPAETDEELTTQSPPSEADHQDS